MGAYYVNHGNLTTVNSENRYDNTACSAAQLHSFDATCTRSRTQHWYQNDFSFPLDHIQRPASQIQFDLTLHSGQFYIQFTYRSYRNIMT